jgi:pimeloyl-ACP methyl ester carboxylesterase
MEAQANAPDNKQLLARLLNSPGPLGWIAQYNIDAAQRTILFWDTLRQRGNQYYEHAERSAPHVLNYDVELVLDGRTFERPVNYALVRIVPPADVALDPKLRPFVVVDPRAGHGPGIGGFKSDSEIGVAMSAGHPCYFVGFLPDPVPGQTIEDIAVAEARFLEKVGELHLDADGKPCVIGNCQAGWAVMMVAAMRPELFGPLIIAGSPLSYWAGERGKNPMRYTGGLLGGSWMTALLSDLGGGKFDGAWLVQNFENLNPSNTYWTKQYNLYSRIDSEAPRYLAFERWWGGHVDLNAEEIQSIVDELFVGNNLAAGRIKSRDGVAIDLRNIHSPIVVFCSKGDNITPPQQALGWIADLYDTVDEMRGYGQTIVYSIHETTGHLGIFVSGGVARKEHGEFSSNIDLIDALPPGLYEAVFTPRDEEAADPGLVTGDWIMRCEERTIEDIRKLCDPADEKLFAAAAHISQSNLALYRTFVQPWIRAVAAPVTAHWMHDLHPLRLQYTLFSDRNPLMAPIERAAQQVTQERASVSEDNFILQLQEMASERITASLDAWRDARDAWAERTFRLIYGSPLIQAAAGIDPAATGRIKKAAKSTLHDQLRNMRIAELRSRIKQGGLREATVRALIYAGLPRQGVDERSFEMMRRIRGTYARSLSLAEFKSLVRAQFLMLLLDEKRAVAAIPAMLPPEADVRAEALGVIRQVLNASGAMAGETERRFDEISQLFSAAADKSQVAASDVHARAS